MATDVITPQIKGEGRERRTFFCVCVFQGEEAAVQRQSTSERQEQLEKKVKELQAEIKTKNKNVKEQEKEVKKSKRHVKVFISKCKYLVHLLYLHPNSIHRHLLL